jgi:hypothetical protein
MGALAAVGALAVTGAYWLWNTPREQKGRMLKRVGKTLGIQSLIDKGREMHYGHLSPEELLVQHPSAFLRQNTIRGHFLQHSLAPLGEDFDEPASPDRSFKLLQMNDPSHGLRGGQITDQTGRRRTRTGDYTLVQDSHLPSARDRGVAHESGSFSGGFLPMLQTTRTDPSPDDTSHFAGFGQGALDVRRLSSPSHPVFTTELTGCSIVRLGHHLAHVRPHPDSGGAELQQHLQAAPSFGRNQYPAIDDRAFVMMRRKADGRVKLYFQKHIYQDNSNSFHAHSGSQYLEPPPQSQAPRRR